MATQQSAQLSPQSRQQKKRGIFSQGLLIVLLIFCVLAILSFVGASIFWIGLVRNKLPDLLGAIFTASGTLFGLIALILAVPPFFQYLHERQQRTHSDAQFINNDIQKEQSDHFSGQTTLVSATGFNSSPNLPSQNKVPGTDEQNFAELPSATQVQRIHQNNDMAIDRNELKKILSICTQTIFENVVFRLNPPGGILSSASVPQGQRANELINWAENDGPGLADLYNAYLIESGKKKR